MTASTIGKTRGNSVESRTFGEVATTGDRRRVRGSTLGASSSQDGWRFGDSERNISRFNSSIVPAPFSGDQPRLFSTLVRADPLCMARWSVLSLLIRYCGSAFEAWTVYPLKEISEVTFFLTIPEIRPASEFQRTRSPTLNVWVVAMNSSSAKEVLEERQHRLPGDGCDGVQVREVLGAHDYAIAGLAAISDATLVHHHVQPFILERFAGRMDVEQLHLT